MYCTLHTFLVFLNGLLLFTKAAAFVCCLHIILFEFLCAGASERHGAQQKQGYYFSFGFKFDYIFRINIQLMLHTVGTVLFRLRNDEMIK